MSMRQILTMTSSILQIRHAFGIFFINIAILVSSGSIVSEIAFRNDVPLYYYVLIWIIISGLIFGLQFRKFKLVFSLIRQRMKNSTKWPLQIKIINGVCWAMPFSLIAFFPEFSQYLLLLGIGLGNISTFIFMNKFSGLNNKEQLLVGVISLALILPAFGIDSSFLLENQDIAVLVSRLFIAASYAIGGIYAVYQKD
ncbi:hypothetical protein BD31_I0998 [Candidatus Nitrosopumilus salaria BD31]|uniref:Uncharacterized protein n=2 Tax=Nitrosopumilus TaxID=338191 RepID=I3D0R5_9ARCH|nr:hypothetical protein BD31_I0998 [Candidatus Nitrosopumilus salaria BD31]